MGSHPHNNPPGSPLPDAVRLARFGLTAPDPAGAPWLASIRSNLLVCAAYALAGALGVRYLQHIMPPVLAGTAPSVGVPWLAVGIGVAGVMRFGLGVWPGV